LSKISEILGIGENAYYAKLRKYENEIWDIVKRTDNKVEFADRLKEWLIKEDDTVKYIVIINMLERAAKMVDELLGYAMILQESKRPEFQRIGRSLNQILRRPI